MCTVTGSRPFNGDCDTHLFSRIAICAHIVRPTIAVKVSRQEPAGVICPNGIHAESMGAPQMAFDGTLIEDRKSLVRTFRAFYARFLADPRTPFIVASGCIAAFPGFLILPPLWIDGSTRAKQIKK
ncbi:hypothetical protein MASR2M8_09230 [Opitutaceae bacterium]